MPIRLATLDDIPAIRALAVDTQMFTAEEAGFVDQLVPASLDGTAPQDRWVVSYQGDAVVGAAYLGPQPFADRVWNVYFIAVAPSAQGHGIGARLMEHLEAHLRAQGPEVARVVLVETSSTEQYAPTRAFYPKQGYVEEARIRDFFGPGDHKVVFWKSLVA